jgi:putative hemolysin
MNSLAQLVQNAIERMLMLKRLNSVYRRIHKEQATLGFIDETLETLRVAYEVSEADLASVPRSGPLLVVANHPFGGVEGLILGSILLGLRPDTRIMANYLLGRIPELREMLLCVDPFNAKGAPARNLKPLREGLRWLRDGHCLAAFPAGSVSHLDLRRRKVVDPEWHHAIARIVQKSGANVLPVFFQGSNGVLFQLAGMMHAKLRTALLPHELLNKGNKTIRVRIGNVIPFKRLDRIESDEKVISYLRVRTYALKYRCALAEDKGPIVFPKMAGGRVPHAIESRPDPGVLAEEVEALPREQLLLESEGHEVFFARSDQVPRLLREIGRLREVCFRQVGEGTGNNLDLDRFDRYYTHLFLWNGEQKEVVGAYRLGQVDLILERFGRKGLYTSTLFDYKSGFLHHIEKGIELGRSFVRTEYQKLYAPLFLLWRGIGHFVARNPRYTVLFGPVTISDTYSAMSKGLMISYLTNNHYAPDLARYIRPRIPVRRHSVEAAGLDAAAGLPADIDHLSSLISEIEADRKGIPVLLKHYVKLGGKLMGFNIDPSFGNGLDGLILVDLLQCDPKILERYMGRVGAAHFFEYAHALHREDLAS